MTDLIPPSFQAKKQKIVSDLALPDEEYSDLSPKGSVDENIRPLIRDINRFPGLVTTSSCAGRISVFLEGGRDEASSDGSEGKAAEFRRQAVSTGGKGGGRWLFVSHDPVSLPEASQETTSSTSQTAHKLFGLTPGDAKDLVPSNVGKLRLVRFHFEPMILHIMCSSLQHAQPVLAAASSSGFRESGLQSLRHLSDPSAYPIVAVRSSGLALESVIGYYAHREKDGDVEGGAGTVRSLVSEEFLRMLVELGNQRFKVNSDRMERFRVKLIESRSSSRKEGWEDADARRERKRAEGLARREAAHKTD